MLCSLILPKCSQRSKMMKLSREEKLFELGRSKLGKEINIVRILRSFREHKSVVKSLIDPAQYN